MCHPHYQLIKEAESFINAHELTSLDSIYFPTSLTSALGISLMSAALRAGGCLVLAQADEFNARAVNKLRCTYAVFDIAHIKEILKWEKSELPNAFSRYKKILVTGDISGVSEEWNATGIKTPLTQTTYSNEFGATIATKGAANPTYELKQADRLARGPTGAVVWGNAEAQKAKVIDGWTKY